VRNLFAFDAVTDFSTQVGDWAGLHFENINYEHPQTWGWKDRLLGCPAANIKFGTFDNVMIGGDLLDQTMIDDSTKFEKQNVSNLVFE
jgi:hypothetical protein